MSLELSVADAMLKGVLNMRGDNCIDSSAVNQAAQMDAITYNDILRRIRMRQCVVKMNAESGGDVTSESALQVNDLTVRYERAHDGVHAVGSEKIIEPLEEAHPVVQVSISCPRMNTVNAAFFATYLAETEQKMLIQFTGEVADAPYNYDLALFFPRLRFLPPEYPDDEITKATFQFQAEEAAANPTGMSYARPYIEIINKQTTDYLA